MILGIDKLPAPEGLPLVDTVRSRQLTHLAHDGLPTLKVLEKGERDALFPSLGVTVQATDYHVERFKRVVRSVNARIVNSGALITNDFIVKYAVFEGAAALSAMRTAVDELVYIAARLAGVATMEADDEWKASRVMLASFDKHPQFKVPTVETLRRYLDWYKKLNTYRNVYRHRGNRETHLAFFPLGSDFPEAQTSDNVMFLPDLASLQGHARPDKWTYNDKLRLETYIEDALKVFRELLDELIFDVWGGPEFKAKTWVGKIQPEEYNIMLRFARPVPIHIGKSVIIPVFSQHAVARDFVKKSPGLEQCHLAEVKADANGTFKFDVSEFGVQLEKVTGNVYMLLDPVGFADDPLNGQVRANLEWPVKTFLELFKTMLEVSCQNLANVERLLVYRIAGGPAAE